MHEFRLNPPAPFSFEKTAAFLSPGPDDVVDVFDGKRYTRLLDVSGRMRLALVSSLGTEQRPELIITLMNGTERDEQGVVSIVSRMLGMSFDLQPFFELCRKEQLLYGLSADHYGLKPAQRMHPFEALCLAISGQRPGGHFLRASFSEIAHAYSYRVAYAGDTFYAFPTPRSLAKQKPEDLILGSLTEAQAHSLHAVASAVVSGDVDLIRLARAPLEVMIDWMRGLSGVGLLGAQWTALLGYGRLACFPTADPLLRSWIGRNCYDTDDVDGATAEQWSQQWGKLRGLVAEHIYADALQQGGAAVDTHAGRA